MFTPRPSVEGDSGSEKKWSKEEPRPPRSGLVQLLIR